MLTKADLLQILEPLADGHAIYICDKLDNITPCVASVYKASNEVYFAVITPTDTEDKEHDED